MPKKNMPEGWEPPYPAWSADLSSDYTDVIIVYYGIQYKSGEENPATIKRYFEKFSHSLKTGYAPQNVERGTVTDGQGYQNHILVCYWVDMADFRAWQEKSPFVHWLNEENRMQGNVGFWIECHLISLNKFETNFSSTNPVGAAALAKKDMGEPIKEHAYWGAMRDRIPSSQTDDFKASEATFNGPKGDTKGRRINLRAPDNLCVIRSGQNWTLCKDAERQAYLNRVHPALKEGMDYLRDNPQESGCLSCRLVTETDQNNNEVQSSFGLAYFQSMKYLEDWSQNHPSHLKIFQNFHELVAQFNFEIDLRLWHEVAVLDKDNSEFIYINCHNKTGILSFKGIV